MSKPQVLISGAGPAGLVLALWLHRFQIPFRIIDKAAEPGLASRAMIVQTRILEFYRQLGIIDRILEAGNPFEAICMNRDNHTRGRVVLKEVGHDLSKYPYSFVIPQDKHEEILNEILQERGVHIERSTELINAVQSHDGVQVTVKKLASGENETFNVAFLAGCDGAHSFVRKLAGIRMNGGTYGKKYFVIDAYIDPQVLATRQPGLATMNVSSEEFCMLIPIHTRGTVRLVGFIPEKFNNKPDLCFEDLEPTLSRITGMEYRGAAWMSIYNLHHRVASQFRVDRIFLCGDACHLHSPTGGQGMNAGIGDACNLAWKLASVLHKTAPECILETYEPERQKFAKTLVSTTDSAFNWMSSSNLVGWLFRVIIMSYVLPFLTRFYKVRRNIFWTMSHLRIAYLESTLSVNAGLKPTGFKAGNRLPWVCASEKHVDNYESLSACSWQIHVYGSLSADITKSLKDRGLLVEVFPWSPEAEAAGLIRDAIYLIRPDGHIGWLGTQSDGPNLNQYMADWGIGKLN